MRFRLIFFFKTALIDEYILSMKNFKTVNPIDSVKDAISYDHEGPKGNH